MTNEKVSIIIPVYNIDKYLEECIESLLRQTYTNIEVIMIDDGSTDESGNICDNWSKYQNIVVIHTENQGVSCARNIGIERATGKYIMFVDGDDSVSPHYVEKMVASIELKDSDIGICNYVKGVNVPEEWESTDVSIDISSNSEILDIIATDLSIGGYLWNKIFKRSTIEAIGLKFVRDISVWEDMIFVCNYLQCVKKVSLISDVLYFYRVRSGSAVDFENQKKKQDKILACRMLKQLKCEESNQYMNNINRMLFNSLLDYGWSFRSELLKTERNRIVRYIKDIGIKQSIRETIKILLLSL